MHGGRSQSDLTVSHIAVPSNPATVSSAPVDIVILGVKHILGGESCANHVATCGVLHSLWLAC